MGEAALPVKLLSFNINFYNGINSLGAFGIHLAPFFVPFRLDPHRIFSFCFRETDDTK